MGTERFFNTKSQENGALGTCSKDQVPRIQMRQVNDSSVAGYESNLVIEVIE